MSAYFLTMLTPLKKKQSNKANFAFKVNDCNLLSEHVAAA